MGKKWYNVRSYNAINKTILRYLIQYDTICKSIKGTLRCHIQYENVKQEKPETARFQIQSDTRQITTIKIQSYTMHKIMTPDKIRFKNNTIPYSKLYNLQYQTRNKFIPITI